MQIFTTDLMIQMIVESRHLTRTMFNVMLDTIGQNIIAYGASAWSDALAGNLLSPYVISFVVTVLFGYSAIRRNLIKSANYVISH